MSIHTVPVEPVATDKGVSRGTFRSSRQPQVMAEAAQIQRLVNEQRSRETRRQADRQTLVEKILFHFHRGMSVANLERNYGAEAVKNAFDALGPEKAPSLSAVVLNLTTSDIERANAASKKRMGAR